jgi:hypothetical protein
MKRLISLFVACFVFVLLPVSASGYYEMDPRFDMTSYVYLSSISKSYEPIVLDGDENVIFDLSGQFESVTFGCDKDLFEEERLEFYKEDAEGRFEKNILENGGVEYELFSDNYNRLQFLAKLKNGVEKEVILCDVVDYEFEDDLDSLLSDDFEFTLGGAGIFYTEDLSNMNYYENYEDGSYSSKFTGYTEGVYGEKIYDNIEVGCFFKGDGDPVRKIFMNVGETEMGLLKLDRSFNTYGQHLSFHGPYPKQVYIDEFSKQFAEEKYYVYKLEDRNYLSESNRFGLKFLYETDLEGDLKCHVRKLEVVQDDEVYEYTYPMEDKTLDVMPEVGLSDVVYGTTQYEQYKYLKDQEIIEGYSDGTFKPDDYINRAEVAKIINEAFLDKVDYEENCFEDVSAGEWYEEHICSLKEKGVVQGVGDGAKFEPSRTVNLVEAYKIIFETMEESRVFEDLGGADWYEPYLEYADEKKIGLSNSFESKKFRNEYSLDMEDFGDEFDKEITRGDFARLVFQAMNREELFADLEALIPILSEGTTKNLIYEEDGKVHLDVMFECDAGLFEQIKVGAKLSDPVNMYYPKYRRSSIIQENAVSLVVDYLSEGFYIHLPQRSDNYYLSFDYDLNLLALAANSGCIDLVGEYLDDLHVDALSDNSIYWNIGLIHIAVDNKDFDLVKYLVEERGADVNAEASIFAHYRRPIHYAVDDMTTLKGNEIEIIEYLLEKGADVNANAFEYPLDTHTTYQLAATEEIKDFLLENGYELKEGDEGFVGE